MISTTMGPITCRLPSGASPSTCRAAATRAVAQATTRPRSAAVPAAFAAVAPQTSRNLSSSSSSSSRIPPPPPQKQRQSQFRPRAQTTPRRQSRLYYHSYDHPSPPQDQDPFFSPAERAILAAAYAHVPEHGFTPRALALGARAAGYLDISAGALPDGVFRLVQWHLASQREALALRSKVLFGGEEGAGERLGVRRKVEMLTWERLMGNRAVVGRLQEVSLIFFGLRETYDKSTVWVETFFLFSC